MAKKYIVIKFQIPEGGKPKRYVVFSGYYIDMYDGNKKFMSCDEVIERYSVDPEECIVISRAEYYEEPEDPQLICLYPRSDCNYKLPTH